MNGMRSIQVILLTALVGGCLMAADITWTGNGGDQDWHNPSNWSNSQVPGRGDNVTIPQGGQVVVQNHAAVEINRLDNSGYVLFSPPDDPHFKPKALIVNGDIQNQGDIIIGPERTLNILCGGNVDNGGHMGSLLGGNMKLACNFLWNQADGELNSNGTLYIRVREDIYNEGVIAPSQGAANISLYCDRLRNYGEIDGGKDDEGSDEKGHVLVHARSGVDNRGHIQAGGEPSSSTAEGDGKSLNVRSMETNRPGPLYSNWAEVPSQSLGKRLAPGMDSPFEILGDSVIVDDVLLTFDTITLFGRHVIFELTDQWQLWGAEGIDIYAIQNGVLDFSATHAAEAIGAGVPVRLFADSIVAPAEGLDFIFTGTPEIHPVDSAFARVLVLPDVGLAGAGEGGAVTVRFQNQSPVANVLAWGVLPGSAWMASPSGQLPLDPLETDSLVLDFIIPGDAALGATDSVLVVTAIDTAFFDTTTVYLFCDEAGDSPVEPDVSRLPDAFTLSAHPNPFNPETSIHLSLPRPSELTLTIYNAAGQRVRTLISGRRMESGTHIISWDGRDGRGRDAPSGTYFAETVTETGRRSVKLMLIR